MGGNRSYQEKLKELHNQLAKEQEENPFVVNNRIANLCFNILQLKKRYRKLTGENKKKLIDILIEHAYTLKTDKRDRNIAKSTFEKILIFDKENPEANYRYAYICYEERNWLAAINYFNRAIRAKDKDSILSEDQRIKAHLFIGYCATMLTHKAKTEANALMDGLQQIEAEGISIDELKQKLEEQLKWREILVHSHESRQLIFEKEYFKLIDKQHPHQLIVDLTTDEYYIRYKTLSSISRHQAVLLKNLLKVGKTGLSLMDLTLNMDEDISQTTEISWVNYRQKVRRLNQKLQQPGLLETRIESIVGKRSYRLTGVNYLVFEYEAR